MRARPELVMFVLLVLSGGARAGFEANVSAAKKAIRGWDMVTAESMVKRLEAAKPKDGRTLLSRGHLQLMQGSYADAARTLREAVDAGAGVHAEHYLAIARNTAEETREYVDHKTQDGKFTLVSAAGATLLSVKTKPDGWKFYDGGGAEMGKITRKGGGYRIKSSTDIPIAKIKPKDGGAMKVYDGADNTIAKVKPKAGKVSVKDDGDNLLFEIKGHVPVSAACFFAIGRFSNVERAGLMIHFWESAP